MPRSDLAASAGATSPSPEHDAWGESGPVTNLRDISGHPTSLERTYRWDEPTFWGGSTCAGSRGYYVEVFRHRGIGLAAVLGNPSTDSWHIASRSAPTGNNQILPRYRSASSFGNAARTVADWTGRDLREPTWHSLRVSTYNRRSGGPTTAVLGGTVWKQSNVVCPRNAPNDGRLTNITASTT